MNNGTSWTPSPEDNILGLTDKNQINEIEAKGLALAELFIFELDSEVEISTKLILEIHKIGFGALYEWAGQWRTTDVIVGQLEPPKPNQVLQQMYQFIDNLNYKFSIALDRETQLDCLFYSHYEFIRIHPFNNGNGRTGRILMNLVALKFGFKPIELYHREGESRSVYINAMKSADFGDFEVLRSLISEELTSF